MAIGELPTGGFARASVMPNPGLVDPRLLAPDYQNIIQGAVQGLQLVNNYNNARQIALDRADANSLRDLRLAAQRQELELAPELLSDRATLARAQANRARYTPIEIDGSTDVVRTPDGDVQLQETVTQIDPLSGASQTVQRRSKPLQTAEQVQAAEALANYRAQQAQTAANVAKAKEAADATKASIDQRRVAAYEQYVANNKARGFTPSELGKKLQERAAALKAGDTVAVQAYDADLAKGDSDVSKKFKQLQAIANTPLANGRTLSDYMILTRNADNTIRQEDAPYWFTGNQDVALDPAAEKLVTQYQNLLGNVTNLATQPAAPGSVVTAAANSLPAASPVREATEPVPMQIGKYKVTPQ